MGVTGRRCEERAGVIRCVCGGRLFLLGLLLTVSAVTMDAQQPLSLEGAGLWGQTIFEGSAATGMVLVIVRNREVAVKSYGETFPGSGIKPDDRSLLRLCSISKSLTGDLLTKLIADGKVGLNDPLGRFAPKGIAVPHGIGASRITLMELATHTSGLPREVGPYPKDAAHFTFPDRAYRWSWLSRQKLARAPGTAALYSNVGFDLLGDALASAAGKTYAQLLHDRIVRPLGLRDTTLTPTKEQCARLLRGNRDEGPCTDTQASGASGGVYSTPADMARVLQYLLRIAGSPAQPSSALAVYLKPAQLKSIEGLSHAGDPTGIGLGWIQLGDPDSPSVLMEKTGGGAGFETYIALSAKQHTGVFLAITQGKGSQHLNFFNEGNNLLASLANVPALPAKVHPARAVKKKHSRAARGKGAKTK